MRITRWSPFQELDSFERRMRRVLDDVGVFPTPLPAADVFEREGEYVYELEVPGFDEDDLAVEIADHTLIVKGKRTEQKEEADKAYRLHERLSETFERRFELPPEANADEIAAAFAKGVLVVRAPKLDAPPTRAIEIGAPS